MLPDYFIADSGHTWELLDADFACPYCGGAYHRQVSTPINKTTLRCFNLACSVKPQASGLTVEDCHYQIMDNLVQEKIAARYLALTPDLLTLTYSDSN